MLEDASDGVGLWSTPDLSLIGIVTNPTFPSLLKLIGRWVKLIGGLKVMRSLVGWFELIDKLNLMGRLKLIAGCQVGCSGEVS
jgi:hypothetical protein